MNTPYGMVRNYGTDDVPDYGGPAGAVGYALALHDVLQAIDAVTLEANGAATPEQYRGAVLLLQNQ